MNIGFLDRRIQIQQQSTTVDAYGDRTGSWSTLHTVWAALDNKSASSSVIAEQEASINRVTWRVRYSTDMAAVTTNMRILYGSDVYNILAVTEHGRKHELHFVTEKVES